MNKKITPHNTGSYAIRVSEQLASSVPAGKVRNG